MPTQVRVAVIQAEPAWLDLDASTAKTISLIEEASQKGAQLIAFPEVWIPGYPAWIWTRPLDIPNIIKYTQNSLPQDSPQMHSIRAAAVQHRINVCLGYAERDGDSVYIAQCLIAAEDGTIKMSRRKIKPTHMERTVFGEGSGGSLKNVVEMKGVGRIGALACWVKFILEMRDEKMLTNGKEHTQPLLKYHTASQNEHIHIAAWPPLFDDEPQSQTLFSLSAPGAEILSRSYAIETQSFVLHSTGLMSQAGLDTMQLQGNPLFNQVGGGRAAVFGPDGRKLSEDLNPTVEGMVVVDLDLDLLGVCKSFVDVVGHYSRPDLLRLVVDSREKKPVHHDME